MCTACGTPSAARRSSLIDAERTYVIARLMLARCILLQYESPTCTYNCPGFFFTLCQNDMQSILCSKDHLLLAWN
jgi:hypothetical protein